MTIEERLEALESEVKTLREENTRLRRQLVDNYDWASEVSREVA